MWKVLGLTGGKYLLLNMEDREVFGEKNVKFG